MALVRAAAVVLAFLASVVPATATAASSRGVYPVTPAPLPRARALDAITRSPSVLVQLTPSVAAPAALTREGATLVSPGLRIWQLPGTTARGLVPKLLRTGALQAVEADQLLVPQDEFPLGDPLVPSEWWIPAVGADRAEPPGPGVPITVVDTGLDRTHPEFAARPATVTLNKQEVGAGDEAHGTAVSSVVAAPANGVGIVGIYPQARLQEWDVHDARVSDVIRGIDLAANRGRSVINLSGGFFGPSRLLTQAVDRAIGKGSIVVAAVGNDRRNGSRRLVPASLPHVFTVAATDTASSAAFFSSRSSALDVAAPGQDIPAAVPFADDATGFAAFDGTSFATPLVSGAAAWVWTARPTLTNTQVLDVLRASAHDVDAPGRDKNTGWGILDLPAALAAPDPPLDPQEPNDDVYSVKPHGLFAGGARSLTGPHRPTAALQAELDSTEDPEDVYRVWVPAHGRLIATVQGDANVDLALWSVNTKTVLERGAALKRDRRDFSIQTGRRADAVSLRNRTSRAAIVYVDVFLGKRTPQAVYTVNVTTSPH